MDYDREKFMLRKLGDMTIDAHNKVLGRGVDSKDTLIEYLRSDRDFQEYDLNALAEAANQWHRSGTRPDLQSPNLYGRQTWEQMRRR